MSHGVWLTALNMSISRSTHVAANAIISFSFFLVLMSSSLSSFASVACAPGVILHAIGGFPDSSVGKASTCSAGDLGLIPGLGRSPGERKGYPLQYSGLEHSMDCTIHGVTKSQTWLRAFHFTALHTVSLPRSISWSFPLCFLLEVLQFWIFNPFWVDLCVV